MADILPSLGPTEVAIFVAVFVTLAAAIVMHRPRKRRWRGSSRDHRFRSAERPAGPPQHDPVQAPSIDAADQLRAVMAANFTARPVLSKTEAAVMAAAEVAIADAGLPWRVMAQVSLGEVHNSPSKAAFNAINAKRVDLMVVSERSRPLAAIEYQGQGHYQGTAPARDAVKKEALRRAGIGYIEITFEHGPEDVKREIGRLAAKLAIGEARVA